jgi:hypothetical protein
MLSCVAGRSITGYSSRGFRHLSTIIRKVVGDRSENYVTVSTEWVLRRQVEALETWLREHRGELDPSSESIADIGFTHRSNACGGGPPFTRELMRMCLDANMEIYVSEYAGAHRGGGILYWRSSVARVSLRPLNGTTLSTLWRKLSNTGRMCATSRDSFIA